MSVSRRMAWNSATIWTNGLSGALIGLALVPLLQLHLGTSGYGLIVVVTTVISLATMADLGLRGALTRNLAAEVARGDLSRINEFFSASLTWLLAVGLTIGTVSWFAAGAFVAWLELPPELVPSALFLLRYYVGLHVVSWLVVPVFGGVLESHHRFDVTNLVHTAEVLARGLLLLLAVGWLDWGIYGWFAGMTLSRIGALVAMMIGAWRICPSLRYQPFNFQFETFRNLATLGGMVFLYWIVFRLSVQIDPLILGKLLGVDATALYEPARLVIASAYPFVAAVLRQLNPMAAAFHATGQNDRLADVLIRGTRWALLLALPFLVNFGCFSDPIIRLVWLGDGYEVTAICLSWWALAELLFYAGGSQWQVLLGMGRIRFIVALEFAMAVINVLASIGCVMYFREAGWGDLAVLGVLFPTIAVRLLLRIVLTTYTAAVVGVPLRQYWSEGYVRPLAALLVLVALGYVLRIVVDPESLISLAVCLTIPLVAWFPCAWYFVMDDSDRARVAGLLRWRKHPSA